MTRSERIRRGSYALFYFLIFAFWMTINAYLSNFELGCAFLGYLAFPILSRIDHNLRRRLNGASTEDIEEMDPNLRKLLDPAYTWNSCETGAVELGAALHSTKLRRVLLSKPSYVPMEDGGVQLEWNQQGFSIEIEVQTDLEMDAIFLNTEQRL